MAIDRIFDLTQVELSDDSQVHLIRYNVQGYVMLAFSFHLHIYDLRFTKMG